MSEGLKSEIERSCGDADARRPAGGYPPASAAEIKSLRTTWFGFFFSWCRSKVVLFVKIFFNWTKHKIECMNRKSEETSKTEPLTMNLRMRRSCSVPSDDSVNHLKKERLLA